MSDHYSVVKRLLPTEKYDRQQAENKYYFLVSRDANKSQIKRAVEALFDVKVNKVNTFNRPGKKKRERRATYGRTAATKRAVVSLASGSTIDLT